MRVLMLSYGYPPVIGGAEQHVRNLSLELTARKHSVAVATLHHEGLPAFEDDGGVRVHRIRGLVHWFGRMIFKVPGRVYAPPFPDPRMVVELRRVVRQERPQIVHAHNWLLHSFLPLKRWSGARIVQTLHSFGLLCVKWNLLYKGRTVCDGPGFVKCIRCARSQYGRKTLPTVIGRRATACCERRAVDRFLPVSGVVAAGNGLAGGPWPMEIVPNFVPDDLVARRDDAAPCLAQLPEQPFLLFVGALTAKKGIHVLLEAYAGLDHAPPLVLIGSRWRDTPSAFPPQVVVLHDWPHAAVMSAWKRCLIGIAPSVWPEPCPTVVLEAMAMGRPVIAARIGGMTEQVTEDETGLLVPPGDVAALRDAMRRLVGDPDLRHRMGEASRKKVLAFTASTVVARIERIYREVSAP